MSVAWTVPRSADAAAGRTGALTLLVVVLALMLSP